MEGTTTASATSLPRAAVSVLPIASLVSTGACWGRSLWVGAGRLYGGYGMGSSLNWGGGFPVWTSQQRNPNLTNFPYG